jgi:UDP-N-acetylmuramate dehydrogenase
MNPRKVYAPLFALSGRDLALRANYDLTHKTSMRMKTTAAVYAEVNSPLALRQLMKTARQMEVPTYILGGGRNTLFATSRFYGLVVSLGRNFSRVEYLGGNCIRAGASVPLQTLLNVSNRCGLMGLEFLTKVPGQVGGSVAGNAGAGNWGFCDFVERVYLITRDGFIAAVDRNQYRYSYRYSELREAIVLEADFRLEPLSVGERDKRIVTYNDRKKCQPYHMPSAGCIFKNPKDIDGKSVSAGKLIDDCGLKGYSIRSAQVSTDHANFIVNQGESSGEDFLALITLVRDIVRAKTGFELKTEVQIVGGPLSSVVLT